MSARSERRSLKFRVALLVALLASGCDSCPPEEYTVYEHKLLEVDPNLDAEFLMAGNTVEVKTGDITISFHQAFWRSEYSESLSDKSSVNIETSRETEFDSCHFEEPYFRNIDKLDEHTRVFAVFLGGAEASAACEQHFETARQSWIDAGEEPPEGLGEWVPDTDFPTISFTIQVKERVVEEEQTCD